MNIYVEMQAFNFFMKVKFLNGSYSGQMLNIVKSRTGGIKYRMNLSKIYINDQNC